MHSALVKQLALVQQFTCKIKNAGIMFTRTRHRRAVLFFTFLVIASLVLINLVTWLDKPHSQPSSNYLNLQSKLENYKSLDWLNSLPETETITHFQSNRSSKLVHYQLEWSVNRDRWPLFKPWFMKNGSLRPSPKYSSQLAIWPEEVSLQQIDRNNDRIVNQLMYIPEEYNPKDYVPKGKLPLKKILLYFGKNGWGDLMLGRSKFIQDKCPVHSCFLIDNVELIEEVDAVIFKDRFKWPKQGRSKLDQLWILFLLECPLHTQMFTNLQPHIFNWTATYRQDSDIVAPYEKFVSYESLSDEHLHQDNVDLFESVIHSSAPVSVNLF